MRSWDRRCLLLPLLLSACNGPGCAPRTSAPTANGSSAPAPAAAQAPGPPPTQEELALKAIEATETALGGKYWLILQSSEETVAEPASVAQLAAHPELKLHAAHAQSSHFKNLKPCYQVVLAGAYGTKDEALQVSTQLKALKIDHYVKNAGAYVGRKPELDEYCAHLHDPPPAPGGCGALAFVEIWEGRTFMKLEGVTEAPKRGRLKMLNERVWAGAYATKAMGGTQQGDTLRLYQVGVAQALGTCTLQGYFELTRGTPHFSYTQDEDGKPITPKEPGCGEAEPFAELRCVLETDPTPEASLFAWPSAGAEPSVFESIDVPPGLLAAGISAMIQSPGFLKAKQRADAEAKAQGEPLRVEHNVRIFSTEARQVLVVDSTLQTGEGNNFCGGEEVRIELRVLYKLEPGKLGTVLIPTVELENSVLKGILDLDGDGHLELFEQHYPERSEIHGEDGADACAIQVPFCDCPC